MRRSRRDANARWQDVCKTPPVQALHATRTQTNTQKHTQQRQKRLVDNNPCFVVFCRGETTRAATSPQTCTRKKELHLHKRSTMDSGAPRPAHWLMICRWLRPNKELKEPAGFWVHADTTVRRRASHGTVSRVRERIPFLWLEGKISVLKFCGCPAAKSEPKHLAFSRVCRDLHHRRLCEWEGGKYEAWGGKRRDRGEIIEHSELHRRYLTATSGRGSSHN